MNGGRVHLRLDGTVARITFDRPEAHNAMTWQMYDQLAQACAQVAQSPARVAVLRGAGHRAFVSGTDIAQFAEFKSADQGVAYEERIEEVVSALESLPIPTIAAVDGWCTGGGLLLAAVCDFRVASVRSSFGAPMARTLGNCLSIANTRRLTAAVGVPAAKRMLMLAENLDAAAAAASGFVHQCVEDGMLDTAIDALCARLASNAPLTMQVAKEAMRRLAAHDNPPGEDLVRACYGSDDFKEGVSSFLEKRPAQWTGR